MKPKDEADIPWKALLHILDEHDLTLVFHAPEMFAPPEIVQFKSFASAPWLMRSVFAKKIVDFPDDLRLIPAINLDQDEMDAQPPAMRCKRVYMISAPWGEVGGMTKDFVGTHRFLGASVKDGVALHTFGFPRVRLNMLLTKSIPASAKPAGATVYWNQEPGKAAVKVMETGAAPPPPPPACDVY